MDDFQLGDPPFTFPKLLQEISDCPITKTAVFHWEKLACKLGISFDWIDQGKRANDPKELKCVNLLVQWRSEQPNNATFLNLIRILTEIEWHCLADCLMIPLSRCIPDDMTFDQLDVVIRTNLMERNIIYRTHRASLKLHLQAMSKKEMNFFLQYKLTPLIIKNMLAKKVVTVYDSENLESLRGSSSTDKHLKTISINRLNYQTDTSRPDTNLEMQLLSRSQHLGIDPDSDKMTTDVTSQVETHFSTNYRILVGTSIVVGLLLLVIMFIALHSMFSSETLRVNAPQFGGSETIKDDARNTLLLMEEESKGRLKTTSILLITQPPITQTAMYVSHPVEFPDSLNHSKFSMSEPAVTVNVNTEESTLQNDEYSNRGKTQDTNIIQLEGLRSETLSTNTPLTYEIIHSDLSIVYVLNYFDYKNKLTNCALYNSIILDTTYMHQTSNWPSNFEALCIQQVSGIVHGGPMNAPMLSRMLRKYPRLFKLHLNVVSELSFSETINSTKVTLENISDLVINCAQTSDKCLEVFMLFNFVKLSKLRLEGIVLNNGTKAELSRVLYASKFIEVLAINATMEFVFNFLPILPIQSIKSFEIHIMTSKYVSPLVDFEHLHLDICSSFPQLSNLTSKQWIFSLERNLRKCIMLQYVNLDIFNDENQIVNDMIFFLTICPHSEGWN